MKVFLIKLPNEKGGIFMWHSSSVEEVSKNLKTMLILGYRKMKLKRDLKDMDQIT